MNASTKQLPLTVPQGEIEAFCRRHHIRQLALFGSVLRLEITSGFYPRFCQPMSLVCVAKLMPI